MKDNTGSRPTPGTMLGAIRVLLCAGLLMCWPSQGTPQTPPQPKHPAALKGFSGFVATIAYSPDGLRLVAGGADGKVCVWDAQTDKLLFTKNLPSAHQCRYSGDGKVLGVSGDGVVFLDPNTGKQLATNADEKIVALAFDPKGRRYATGGLGKDIVLWDQATGKRIGGFPGQVDVVTSLTFAPDGKTLASNQGMLGDGSVKLWDVAKQQLIRDFDIPGLLWCAAISPDGQYLATGSLNGSIFLWEMATGKEAARFGKHREGVLSVSFSPDGTLLASGGGDEVRLWDLKRQQLVAVVNGFGEQVTKVMFAPGGKFLATGTGDQFGKRKTGEVKVWDVAQLLKQWPPPPSPDRLKASLLKASLTGAKDELYAVAYCPDGKYVAAAGEEKNSVGKYCIRLWEVSSKKVVREFFGHSDLINHLAFSTDGKLLATGGNEGTAIVWSVVTGKSLVTVDGHEKNWLRTMLFMDNTTLVTASGDMAVKVWDVRTGECKKTHFTGGKGSARGMVWSRDLQRVAFCSALDEDIQIREWPSFQPRDSITLRNDSWLTGVLAFSPNAKLLAVGTANSVLLFNLKSGKRLAKFTNRFDEVRAFTFLADGAFLAVGEDWDINIWDVAQRKKVLTLRGTDAVNGLAVSPDGQTLASVGDDRRLHLWDITKLAPAP